MEQNLIVCFPDLPKQLVNGFRGYWGRIDMNNHNAYKKYPSLRVYAEAICQSLSDMICLYSIIIFIVFIETKIFSLLLITCEISSVLNTYSKGLLFSLQSFQ